VGESPAIRHVLDFIAKVAPLDATVLIAGEQGTGKTLAARALHLAGPRARKPFVTVNCAALNETLLDRELFGGKLEQAQGGTLFLDEIASVPLLLGAKLMRLLEGDVHLIAATSRDLARAVGEGAFPQDLYYRLRVLSVEVPPLRGRREDIPLLANYFRVRQSARQKRRVMGITAPARQCLVRYDWPGNVRELEIAIEIAVAAGSTEGILPEDLPESVLPLDDSPDGLAPRYHRAVNQARREAILQAYRQAQWDQAGAAALLGLHPQSLDRLVRMLDVQAAVARQSAAGEP
jgi:two-component system response regulator HydG